MLDSVRHLNNYPTLTLHLCGRYTRDYDELESISEVQSTIPEDPSLEDEETNNDSEKKGEPISVH